MRKDHLALCLRTWAFCALGVLALVSAGYGLNAIERQFFPAGARGGSEWLIIVPLLALGAFAFALLYVALVALLTAVAALLPEGRARAYIDGQLQKSGTLERTVSGWSQFGRLLLRCTSGGLAPLSPQSSSWHSLH